MAVMAVMMAMKMMISLSWSYLAFGVFFHNHDHCSDNGDDDTTEEFNRTELCICTMVFNKKVPGWTTHDDDEMVCSLSFWVLSPLFYILHTVVTLCKRDAA